MIFFAAPLSPPLLVTGRSLSSKQIYGPLFFCRLQFALLEKRACAHKVLASTLPYDNNSKQRNL
jgi:hypothetical protein